jgi:spermidine synthase
MLPLLLVVPLFLVHAVAPASKIMPNGTRVTKVFEKDGFYGNVKVIDYSYGRAHTRELVIDGLVQGGIDMNNGLSIYDYAYFMEFLPYGLNPAGKDCLVIGLGAGLVPRWYEERGIKVDVVDIDPNMPGIAREYFGFRVSGDVVISDARYFLGNTDKQYDYIILDVFNGDTTPGHVLSVEAMKLLKDRLTRRGVLAVNLAGSIKKEAFMTASVIRTIQSVFETVDVYPTFFPEGGDGWGNLAIVAYHAARVPLRHEAIRDFPVHPVSGSVRSLVAKPFLLSGEIPAIILSDDYNPIDFYDIWLKESIRKNILENTDWDILI